MNFCPNCGKSVDNSTKFCTNCGTSLEREKSESPSTETVVLPPDNHGPSPEQSASPESPLEPKVAGHRIGRCKYCNKIIHVGDNPCPNCGHELNWTRKTTNPTNGSSPSYHTQTRKEKSHWKWVFFAVLIIGIVCWVIWGLLPFIERANNA